MERYLIIFKGRVQGVGFRYTAQRYANDLNLTGYVKNLDNGDVKVEVQGESSLINNFIHTMLNIKSYIQVDDYFLKQIELVENEKRFSIKY